MNTTRNVMTYSVIFKYLPIIQIYKFYKYNMSQGNLEILDKLCNVFF